MSAVGAPRFPSLVTVRQRYPQRAALDVTAALDAAWTLEVRPGSAIAVGVGSRGIARIDEVVGAVIARLRGAGARPFIVPAMGSHAGATAEGQAALLAGFGVSEARLGVPVRASMETTVVGHTDDGVPVHLSVEALRSDGIVVVNRVKPHTQLRGPVESGLTKMFAVGLGKHDGAAAFHGAQHRFGFPRVLGQLFAVLRARAPLLGGVGLIEEQRHQLHSLAVLRADELEAREPALLEEARRLMPRLPFDDIDLLVVDRMGKNISGVGMDPNIIGRSSNGYSSALVQSPPPARPFVRRLVVRDLTPESHGNAIGIGLADFTTTRLVRSLDPAATYTNALTSLSLLAAKIPIHFDSDRELLARALGSLALDDPGGARVVRIRDTLSLERLQISTALTRALEGRSDLVVEDQPRPFTFDAAGQLLP